MSRRCVLGCGSPETLFPFPKNPWLRTRWLEFLHFQEGGISDRSRLCSKHFTRDSFRNWTQHEMGFVRYLSLKDAAVPSVYTVGTSNHTPQSSTPLTRDVACQCEAPSLKRASIQTETHKKKIRSKAIQVKPIVHSVGVSVGTGNEPPCLTSTSNKRPRVEDITFDESSTCTLKQEASEEVCEPLHRARKYMVYEDNLLKLLRKCPAMSVEEL